MSRKLFAWQRRRARRLGVQQPMCGAVTFCQRFGSLLNLNCHFHSILPDAVFAAEGDTVRFIALPPPWPDDIDRLLRQIARAIEALIDRRMRDRASDPPDLLAHEQARVTQTTTFKPAASDHNRSHKRLAFVAGYSLHAERWVDVEHRDALERLCRYGARAPIANTRLSIADNGNAVLALRRPLRDGRTQLTSPPNSSSNDSPR